MVSVIEDEVSPSLFHLLHITVQVARISLQVFVGAELDGVHEYRDYRTVVLTGRLTNQTLMTFVQIAHRGHQTDTESLLPPGRNNLSYFFYSLNYLHILD